MEWKPDKKSNIPLYQQIADYIKRRIIFGEYPPGTTLPSERSLSNLLNVNRGTVIAAYNELTANDMVERVKGCGTKVSNNIWGLTETRIPNWNLYEEGGSFLPNPPLFQYIRDKNYENNLINFASPQLSDDLMPYQIFKEILKKNDFNHSLGYEHPQGNLELRETIVMHLKKFKNINCTSQSILITSGAQQAIHLIIFCLLNPGDTIAFEDPSYAFSLPIFRSLNIRTIGLPVGENGINPEDILILNRKHKIKMIFLNPIFQNPTGTILSLENRKKVLDITEKLGILTVMDDPYSLISFSKETNTTTLKSMDKAGRILYISSLSKLVAAGLRVGWIVGPQNIIKRLADAKQQMDFGHSVFSKWVANEFLKSNIFENYLQQLKQRLLEKRNLLISTLQEELPDYISFQIPKGGTNLWCRLNKEVNVYSLLEDSIQNGVAFMPGSLFGSKTEYIRLSFSRPEINQIHEGVLRLKKALKAT